MIYRRVNLYRITTMIAAVSLMAACTGQDSTPTTAQEEFPQPAAPQQQTPQMASPGMETMPRETDLAQIRIPGPVTVVDQPISDVLRMLHDHTGIQFLMGVDGLRRVTLSLTDPTVVEILQALRDEADIGYELRSGVEGPVIAIMDAEHMPAAEAPLTQPEMAPPVAEGEIALERIPPLQTVIQGPVTVSISPSGTCCNRCKRKLAFIFCLATRRV